MFFGIKCYINQARNNIFTNPSVIVLTSEKKYVFACHVSP